MTDYETYVAEPAEAPPPERFARLRPPLAWAAAMLVLLALGYTWFQGTATEDPSLSVPAEQLTTPPADQAPAAPAPAEPPA